MSDTMHELKVRRIESGTVIDHIPHGQALNVLKILGIRGGSDAPVSLVMNVVRRAGSGRKDIVKIENRELAPSELQQIAFIAPDATVNIVRDYNVVEKHKVELPKIARGVLKCANPNCISNTSEPILSEFVVESTRPVVVRCVYCERRLSGDLADHLL